MEAPASVVAPWLLNKLLVSNVDGHRVVGRITEVEAYEQHDPASHTFRGRTKRNATMFGPPGHMYVYLSYGIHRCANMVTGAAGEGSAVLIRSVTIEDGVDVVRERRGPVSDAVLSDGPGKLCQALAIRLDHDGLDVLDLGAPGAVQLLADGTAPPADPLVGPRIGLSKAVETPWRFRVPRS